MKFSTVEPVSSGHSQGFNRGSPENNVGRGSVSVYEIQVQTNANAWRKIRTMMVIMLSITLTKAN